MNRQNRLPGNGRVFSAPDISIFQTEWQCIVPTGLDSHVAVNRALKRWASIRCAYGALEISELRRLRLIWAKIRCAYGAFGFRRFNVYGRVYGSNSFCDWDAF